MKTLKKILLIILLLCTVCYAPPISMLNFNNGQVSPQMEARSDFPKQTSSCRIIENMMVLSQGPVSKRPGTKYIATTKDNNAVRLIPFKFSTEDTYTIEVGNGYMRFYRTGGTVDNP